MARFVFQLEGVLRHRRMLEQQRQRDVAVAAAAMQTLDAQLRALDAEVKQATGEVRQNHLVGPLDLNFLAAHRRYLAAMQRKAMSIAEAMAAAQRERDAARSTLAEASKQRKILETLRDKHYQDWLADQGRREFSRQDDLYTQLTYQRDRERAESAGDESEAPAGSTAGLGNP